MSKLLRRSIKKFTIPSTRRSSTPTTSLNSYWDASRGWIPRKLGTHSGVPSITSAIFLYWLWMRSWILCNILLQSCVYSFGTSSTILFLHSMFSYLLRLQYHLMYYLEDFVIIPQFFYLHPLQYIKIGLLKSFLVYQPYVILPFISSPMITSSFERFPWDTSLSHSCLRI